MERKKLRLLRLALLSIALCLLGFGLARGEVQVIAAKATRICMECIGLG